MRKIVITGGAGFIGSHIVEHFVGRYPDARIVVFDKMTYAADFRNLGNLYVKNAIDLVVGDICDYDMCVRVLRDCDLLIHAAAESHVDNSFHSSLLFTQTNVVGTHTILEACRDLGVPRIIHVSTDEVYGEVLEGAADEATQMNPTNPYSASKAAAEMVIKGYIRSFNQPILIVRANNVFGTRQYPEKLIPKCCISLIRGDKIPLHGNGQNIRHYLAARDLASAIDLIAEKGEVHEVYNVGSEYEYPNHEVVKMICDIFGKPFDEVVEFVSDRPFNDRRYSVEWSKITALGWEAKYTLAAEMPDVVAWYRMNADRYIGSIAPPA